MHTTPTHTPAHHPPLNANSQVGDEYLSFRLGGEEYGIDILRVQEIRGQVTPTRMVSDRPFIKGVVNLRGVIVPIIDLRTLLGLEAARSDSDRATVVITVGVHVVGLVVDAVSDVVRLQARDIKPTPEFCQGADTDHIVGLASPGSESARMLILMDVHKLMRRADMGLGTQAVH